MSNINVNCMKYPYLTLNEMFWRILWWSVAYWQISGAHLSLKHAIYGLSLCVPVISSNTLSKTFNAKPFVFKQHKWIPTSFQCFIIHLGELNAKKCLAKYFVNYDMHASISEKLYYSISLSCSKSFTMRLDSEKQHMSNLHTINTCKANTLTCFLIWIWKLELFKLQPVKE